MILRRALRSGRDVTVDADMFTRRDGAVLWVSYTSAPILTAGQVTGAVVTFRDCAGCERVEEELAARVRQQAAVAELGQRALAGPELTTFMGEAVALVARTLGVEYGTVLELLPDGTALRLRAGVGWQDRLVGQAIVGLESQAGYTLASGEPVIVHDLHTERRFRESPLLRAHGVASGVSVIIPGQERPFGVLGVHATQRRPFPADDVHFLQAMANVLAAAVERHETEEHLREREAQYRNIFEATTDGLVIIDLSGAIVEVNPAYCALFGYSRGELIGRPYRDLFHPDSLRDAGEAFATVLAGGVARAHALMVRKDGALLHVEGQGVAFTYMGKPHLLGIARNITERVHAEEQLREKEAQYRAIFEATIDGLVIDDPNGVIVEANPAYCAMFGYSYDELIGLPYTVLLPPDQHDAIAQGFAMVLAGHPVHGRTVCLRKDGTLFHAEGHATSFTYRGRPHVLAVQRDITERVRAEEQLREKEAQYRGIFEATTEGTGIFDLNGMLVEVNPACCQILGYSYEEMIGRHVAEFIHPDYHRVVAEFVAAIEATGTARTQIVDVRKDGTLIPVDVHGTAFVYNGRPHVLGMLRDITEQVRAYELLEQRVAERTRELSALLEVSHNVASTLELAPLLGLILEQLKTVVDNTGAAIFTAEGEYLRLLDYRGPLPREQMVGRRFPLDQAPSYQEILRNGVRPTIVDDVWGDSPLAQAYQRSANTPQDPSYQYIRSLLVVPLKVKERLIGVVRIDHSAPHAYTPQHATLVLAFANQAAVAIENARLYARAQDMAALEERQRLARELHDSVTQALYGVTLYAEAATRLLAAGEPETATTYVHEVRATAQEALQEMRLLIFELRPPILEQEGLVAALQARLAAVEGRVPGLVATVDAQSELRLPTPIEEALYRIAQETLNNVLKHAKAHTITLSLRQEGSTVTLRIADDGVGFDRAIAGRQGGFGLRGMAERAAQVGGAVTVQSAPGQGTVVRVEVTL
jgi:PAS domain S-box-containing protein